MLDGKVALITGAGSGIGRASAELFGEEGASVMCADVNLDGARQTAATVSERGGSAAAVHLDVADSAAVENALVETARLFGTLDVLFNNAGVLDQNWNRVISINLTGVYNGLFYGCRMLAERGGGSIVSTASIMGLVGMVPLGPEVPEATQLPYGAYAYQAAKGAVVQLTRQFAVTFAKRGVRVNAVAPGYIHTPMGAAVVSVVSTLRGGQEPGEEWLAGLHPMGRLGESKEVAAAAAFLASDAASFITGVTLPVDGGYTAR